MLEQEEYIPHEFCARCGLILAQDLCVCGWRRPRPAPLKRSRDWIWRALAVMTVGGVLWGLSALVS